MDRSLSPELLSLALGQQKNLPSPEALADLLAKAELALLLRRPDVSEELISIGWYLHAVASSKYALRTYGVERQRAAFSVAGHVFDLLLHTPEIDRLERLKYCFAAQIAYLRGALDPNALAMYRREFANDLSDLGLLSHFLEVALSCGIAFLGMDVGYLQRVTRSIRAEIDSLVVTWAVEGIGSTPFGSAAGVALGTQDLMNFLLFGTSNALESARETLWAAVIAEASEEDQMSRWVAAHLLNLAEDLERASVWTVLPPEIPSGVRKAFTIGHPKIVTLWPPQLDLLGSGDQQGGGPLSREAKRLFLSTPTSSGKTLLAQLLVVSHLSTEQTSVCYVAPTRSLCREIRRSLEDRLRFVGREVADGLPEGDWLDDLTAAVLEPGVEVMTPERLSYLIRSDSHQVLERFGLFIFDEVHMVGEVGRGWTLEEDLAYLHYATQDTEHRIVLMSAAVGNQHHFVQWMGGDAKNVLYHHSEWRGPRRLHAIWRTEADWSQPVEEATRGKKYLTRQRLPLYGRLDTRISHTGTVLSLRTTEPVGNLALRLSADGEGKKDPNLSTPFYKMLVSIIQHLCESGPVLVIEATRAQTVRTARAIAASRDTTDLSGIEPLIELVETRLGREHPLWGVLNRGVAYHYGSLPSEIREAIEESVSQGRLKCLVATTTMTEGINLPVRSVVIASQGSHTSQGYEEYITGAKLINAIGRAGRAGKETEGVAVLALKTPPKQDDFDRLEPADTDITVMSVLATQEALEALASFEELQRRDEDAVFQTSAEIVSQFLAFVWFVAAQLEQIAKLPTQERVAKVLEHTLAWIQLSPDDRNRWLSVAGIALGYYARTDTRSRQRWATAGTCLGSAAEMEAIAREVAMVIANTGVSQSPAEAVSLILDEGRLQRVLSLRETPRRTVFDRRGGKNRQEITIPVEEILLKWIEGAELVTLANTFFGAVPDIAYRFEQLGDFIGDYFEVFFPWVFGTIIAWTNDLLEEDNSDNRLPRTVPAHVRWGVGSRIALELMARGIQSRSLATKIAQEWEDEKRDSDVRSWLQSMTVSEWQHRFGASALELRSLLDLSRDQVGGVTVTLVSTEYAAVEVESYVTDLDKSEVLLAPVPEWESPSIGIWQVAQLVGCVPSRYQADIQEILDTGLRLLAEFSASFGKGLLELRLIGPED